MCVCVCVCVNLRALSEGNLQNNEKQKLQEQSTLLYGATKCVRSNN